MDLGMAGRTAVITGGSKGIGKGIARVLAGEGVSPVLLARNADDLNAAVDEIQGDFNVRVLGIETDVTDLSSVKAAAAAVRDHPDFGKVNILVSNAGSAIRRQDRQIIWDDDEWQYDIEVKTVGALRMFREFLPLVPDDGSGRIINIAGVAGLTAWDGALTHGINNAALNHMVGYLAQDLADRNITVNSIIPGLIATEWRELWASNMAEKQGVTKEAFLDDYCRTHGIVSGRWATVEEVGDVVAFVASDRGIYINGARIPVDGGVSINARS
jgi:NAD(P)-dependent dehydrogenase (short-subunit alcohol dehydrogenase family)